MYLLSLAVKPDGTERICLLQDYLRMGGTERHSVHLCQKWSKVGTDVMLLTARPGGALAPIIQDSEVDWRSAQPFDFKLNWFPPSLGKILTEFNPQRVVMMGRVANEQGSWLRRRFPSIELTATVRTGRRFTRRYIAGLLDADAVRVNSDYAHERVLAIGVDPKRVVVDPNEELVQLSREERLNQRAARRHSFGVPGDTKVLLQVGAFRPGKRHSDLLEVFRSLVVRHPNTELWWVGAGPLMSKLQRNVSRAGLSQRVRFFGIQLDVSPLYYAADIAVTASVEESNSNFVLEARRAGLPVIAQRSGGTEASVLGVDWVDGLDALEAAIEEKIQ
ncbi:MAG: glycosyltransferase [Opitutales bacterium]|nr:glycosyltransferase [Opitutales bacterium]